MQFRKFIYRCAAFVLGGALLLGMPLTALAERDYQAEMEARRSLPVQTNELANWPKGPQVGARSAILMDANTGAILYSKNIDEQHYPASVTKLMTCLLAIENCQLDEIVTFSHEAVFSIERGSSNIGMDVGEAITMEQALQAILILSANEVANAVGEHIAGDAASFAEMMNKRADELGCTNTHFMNANGLHDENHYTSARDLALIAQEFFRHDVLATISGTTYCTFEATATQPDSFSLATKNQLVKGKEHEYEYLVGSKTGYTSDSRQTLVSCARKDGMELICVVLVEESPYQFTDTIALFDYGFQNFSNVNIAANDTTYTMNNTGFFASGSDIFGDSTPFISLEQKSMVTLPNTLSFQDLESEVTYDSDYSDSVATVSYHYQGNYVGEGYILLSDAGPESFSFGNNEASGTEEPASETDTEKVSEGNSDEKTEEAPPKPITNEDENNIFINVKLIVIILICIVVLIIAVLTVISIVRNYHFAQRRKQIMRKNRRRNRISESNELKFPK